MARVSAVVRHHGGVSDLIDELLARGLVADHTDLEALRAELAAGPVTLYCGFDPTAPSLHLGNLIQLLTVRRFQLAGHLPLALVGGATGLIGDPKESGERSLNGAQTVTEWSQRIRSQAERFLDFDGPSAAHIVNNYEWTRELSAIALLREVGKHFSVNRMLDREAVRARLAGNGISFTEFSYQLLQANDYLELHERHGCRLQTGGSDQWGNLTAGVDLVRRVTGEHVHALCTPLLTKADGTKFGKTEAGTVWLDPELTSPYAFHQFWINADDRDVPSLLRTFSFRDLEEIAELERATAERPRAREGQRALADEVTALVHGEEQARAARNAAAALFGRGDLASLPADTLTAALLEAPNAEMSAAEIAGEPWPAVSELLARCGVVASRGAARRAIKEGGAYLNNERVTDEDARPSAADVLPGGWLVVRRGRKTMGGIRLPS